MTVLAEGNAAVSLGISDSDTATDERLLVGADIH